MYTNNLKINLIVMEMKTKPINIFEFYAPTGGGSKIADAMNVISDAAKKVNSNSATSNSGNPTIPSSAPKTGLNYESASNSGAGTINNSGREASNGKTNNLGWWIMGGVIVGSCLWLYIHSQKKKKEEDLKNKIKSDKMRNKKSDASIDEYINKRG
jgi:hypothetical protein